MQPEGGSVATEQLEPSLPLVPLEPFVPLAPSVPFVPFVPFLPFAPLAPSFPSVPLAPLAPSVPLVPFLPSTPLVPSTPLTPPQIGAEMVVPHVTMTQFLLSIDVVQPAPSLPAAPVAPVSPLMPEGNIDAHRSAQPDSNALPSLQTSRLSQTIIDPSADCTNSVHDIAGITVALPLSAALVVPRVGLGFSKPLHPLTAIAASTTSTRLMDFTL